MLKQLQREEQTAGGGPARDTVRRGQLSSSSLGLPDVLLLTLGAVGVDSLSQPYGFPRSNSTHQVLCQMPFPTEPPH